ncbi:hypothetical protein CPB83DRAFT_856301 [Crepidotus variabilis]|uniref:Uncharacterized protein n=1 Tax=Crepidotus variabilis TaxID=179855 RepID=A0A9P6EE33_9AGAR|nr:hypothetical protein CPB83DRAFT_856301 [Crepidotus variabilis]
MQHTSKAFSFASQLPKHHNLLPASRKVSVFKASTSLRQNLHSHSQCVIHTKSRQPLKLRSYSTTPNPDLKPNQNVFRAIDASLRELGLSGPAYWFIVGTFSLIALLESAFWAQLLYRKFWTKSEGEGETGVLKEWAGWWGGWLGFGKEKEKEE